MSVRVDPDIGEDSFRHLDLFVPVPRRTQLSIFTVIDVLPIRSMLLKHVTSSPTMTGR